MENTSRRNFITGLATGAVAVPITATASIEKQEQHDSPALDELKPGLQYALRGYLMQWAYYDNLTQRHLNQIESDIQFILLPLKLDGILCEDKVVAKMEDGRLNIKIGLKTEPSKEYKIWTMQVFSNKDKWKDNA